MNAETEAAARLRRSRARAVGRTPEEHAQLEAALTLRRQRQRQQKAKMERKRTAPAPAAAAAAAAVLQRTPAENHQRQGESMWQRCSREVQEARQRARHAHRTALYADDDDDGDDDDEDEDEEDMYDHHLREAEDADPYAETSHEGPDAGALFENWRRRTQQQQQQQGQNQTLPVPPQPQPQQRPRRNYYSHEPSGFDLAMQRMRELVATGAITKPANLRPPPRLPGSGAPRKLPYGRKVRGAGWHRRGYRDYGNMWINVREGSYGCTRGGDVDENETLVGFVRHVFGMWWSQGYPAGCYPDLRWRKQSLIQFLVQLENEGYVEDEVVVRDYLDGGETVYFQVYDAEGRQREIMT